MSFKRFTRHNNRTLDQRQGRIKIEYLKYPVTDLGGIKHNLPGNGDQIHQHICHNFYNAYCTSAPAKYNKQDVNTSLPFPFYG